MNLRKIKQIYLKRSSNKYVKKVSPENGLRKKKLAADSKIDIDHVYGKTVYAEHFFFGCLKATFIPQSILSS